MGVAQPDAPDVARLRVDVVGQVEAAEDQALVGSVELGDPLGGLEDHRVALDEPAFVAELPARVTLLGQLLGSHSGVLELGVDPVDERLLVGDLLLGLFIRHSHCPFDVRPMPAT